MREGTTGQSQPTNFPSPVSGRKQLNWPLAASLPTQSPRTHSTRLSHTAVVSAGQNLPKDQCCILCKPNSINLERLFFCPFSWSWHRKANGRDKIPVLWNLPSSGQEGHVMEQIRTFYTILKRSEGYIDKAEKETSSSWHPMEHTAQMILNKTVGN